MPELSDDAKGHWRPMRRADVSGVLAVAARVHPCFPEDADVFDERLRLYPRGCFAFAKGDGVAGYLISHPWRANDPPALNVRLGALPQAASTYYIHDLALLPEVQGAGVATSALKFLIARAQAEGLATLSLVAVNGSGPYWRRHGFRDTADAALAQKLRSYDEAAIYMVRRL
jgi:GNAT superfamily N-acetyltransferase